MRRVLLTAACAGALLAPVRGQSPGVEETVARIGARVIEWYARAQNIVSAEEVVITPMRFDMSPAELPRRLTYELRVAWDAPAAAAGTLPEPTVLRELRAINGRAPKPAEEPECMDPKPITSEPLMMLLPGERDAFAFTHAGTTRMDGRAALVLDYKGIKYGPPKVTWTKECVSISLPGRARGRIWVDAETFDVLRLDESLIGMFDVEVPREQQRRGASRSLVVERAQTSIRYRRVQFDDPAETLMLPAQVDSFTIIRGNATRRTRISQRFSNHRRYVADVRMLD